MGGSITYRMMKPADAEQVSDLVRAAFDAFIARESTAEGIAAFRRYADPDAIRTRTESGSHFVMVAEVGGRLAGITEIRDCNHVALLFVGKEFHRRGIARGLFDRALQQARVTRPDVERDDDEFVPLRRSGLREARVPADRSGAERQRHRLRADGDAAGSGS